MLEDNGIQESSGKNYDQLSEYEKQVLESVIGDKWKKYGRVTMAALGGIPWIGSLLGAAATYSAEQDAEKHNKLVFLWMREHEEKIRQLARALNEIYTRFDQFGDSIKDRIESEAYLLLVRRTFRLWDQADTLEKKEMFKKLITNSGAITWAEDDLIRMFLDWIDKYHEFHFAVIKEIYNSQRITKGAIWEKVRGDEPREDSADADLFKLLIRELSTGQVIRLETEVDYYGRFVKKQKQKNGSPSNLKESAFEDTKPLILTALGAKFVHYVMDDLAPQIEENKVTE